MKPVLAVLLLLAALASPLRVGAQPEDCSIRYFLDNDPNYWSSGSFTQSGECERRLLPELRARSAPTVEERYVVARLLEGHARMQAEAAKIYRRLCEIDEYGRACMGYISARAQSGDKLPESEEWRFVERAAQQDIPSALYYMGGRHALRYKETS
jgi:hypothetical protein